MLRYAITDRRLFLGDAEEQLAGLVAQAGRLAQEGVDYLQLREKDLPHDVRLRLAAEMLQAIHAVGGPTRLLWSGDAEAALQAGAHGVHLDGTAMLRASANDLRKAHRTLLRSASCHTIAEVEHAHTFADLILFAPVFEKRVAGEQVLQGCGLELLRNACHAAKSVPVLALGGVTSRNVEDCMAAGAAGYAAIRAFL